MVLYSKFTYGSQFLGEKNALEIRFPVAEKLSKYKRSIFFETPCSFMNQSMVESEFFHCTSCDLLFTKFDYVCMTMYDYE